MDGLCNKFEEVNYISGKFRVMHCNLYWVDLMDMGVIRPIQTHFIDVQVLNMFTYIFVL